MATKSYPINIQIRPGLSLTGTVTEEITVSPPPLTGTLSVTPNPVHIPAGQQTGETTITWTTTGAKNPVVLLRYNNQQSVMLTGRGGSQKVNWINDACDLVLSDLGTQDIVSIHVDVIRDEPQKTSGIPVYLMNALPGQVKGLRLAGAHVRVPWNYGVSGVRKYADDALANGQTILVAPATGNPGDCWLPSGYTEAGKNEYVGEYIKLIDNLDSHPGIKAWLWSFGEWDEINGNATPQTEYYEAYLWAWIAMAKRTQKTMAAQVAAGSNYARYWLVNATPLPPNAVVKLNSIQRPDAYGKEAGENGGEKLGLLAILDAGYRNVFGQRLRLAAEMKGNAAENKDQDKPAIDLLLSAPREFVDVQPSWLSEIIGQSMSAAVLKSMTADQLKYHARNESA